MLVLRANEEQVNTFDKIIQTMGSQVAWEGRFIVLDDQLIMEGTVRSLCFQFDAREVVTDLIDLPVQESVVLDMTQHPKLEELVNMALYAFGKWGMLKGLRVDQSFSQLNQLFNKILSMYYIEPAFRKENFRFYKQGVRITYEEVFETVLESEKRLEDDPAAESAGLWHKLIWKNRQRSFKKEQTTLAERMEDRIGNNFYHVGYQCPKCSQNLYMAVYPDGKEMRIDTEELGVYLARVYTCQNCNCFYTPRPERLLSEGLIYEMAFGDDTKAYEDYLELLGESAERAANFKYNEYEALRNRRLRNEEKNAEKNKEKNESKPHTDNPDFLNDPKDALRQMEEFSRKAGNLSDAVFQRFVDRVEEGFYPDFVVAKHEKKILAQVRKREEKAARNGMGLSTGSREAAIDETINGIIDGTKGAADSGGPTEHSLEKTLGLPDGPEGAGSLTNSRYEKNMARNDGSHDMALNDDGQYDMALNDDGQYDMALNDDGRYSGAGQNTVSSNEQSADPALGGKEKENGEALRRDEAGSTGRQRDSGRPSGFLAEAVGLKEAHLYQQDIGKLSERSEKYKQRIFVIDRLSERQKTELKRDINNDKQLTEYDKKELLKPIEEYEFQVKVEAIERKFENSRNRNYANIRKVIRDLEEDEMPQEAKQAITNKLDELGQQCGMQEVRALINQTPDDIDRTQYQELEHKLKRYDGLDLSPFDEDLKRLRTGAEKKEISYLIKRSRKRSRQDLVTLMRRLEDREFTDESVEPYMGAIQDKVREMDKISLDKLLGNLHSMDLSTAAAVYERIEQGNFLPELKIDALEMLSRRLQKIRTDECELLVRKLQEEMDGTIKENARHHFYPARKVMLKTAEPEEIRVIENALKAYAPGRSKFEYPIFTVDTSRDHSGREGMMLTPENLFYSTRLNAYEIPVDSIESISASTGLLNRKLTLEEANGARHKLPYAVGTGEMQEWAEILEGFIQYLQEKPESRKLEYLAKDKHDTICCYRCGYVYHNREICPECGYKKNR